jgi:hypothetical protein
MNLIALLLSIALLSVSDCRLTSTYRDIQQSQLLQTQYVKTSSILAMSEQVGPHPTLALTLYVVLHKRAVDIHPSPVQLHNKE